MEQLCNRVVQVGRFGGPDGLEVVAAALPTAGRGEVRVRVQRGGHSEPMRVLHRRRHARRGCRLVLEDVSFDVPPGVCVGIVGPTGAGKTTPLGLLPRFYDPGRGRSSSIRSTSETTGSPTCAGSSPSSSRSRSSSRRASPRTSRMAARGRTRPRSSPPPPRQAPTSSSRGPPAGTTARAHSASATWCSRSRTAGWCPSPRRKEP